MKDWLIWSVYNVLFAVGYTLMLPKFLLRMWRRGGYRQGFMQRFGIYDEDTSRKLAKGGRVWVHAVSVGEVFVALHFIDELRRALPQTRFILSTTTSTGYAQAKSKIHSDDALIYFPTDFPGNVRRVVARLNPRALILTECELWPNLLRHLNRKSIPVFVVNARISASSYKGYRKIRPFFRRATDWITLFIAQSRLDQQRLTELGTKPDKIIVEGSAKYDVASPDPDSEQIASGILREAGLNPAGKILVAGSTWPGEEELILQIFRQAKTTHADLQLILVPRHMERRGEVEALLQAGNFNYIKRTDMQKSDYPDHSTHHDILLADTTGELKHYYSIATVVFIGKSMDNNFGGQNPIEPAMFGKPIVVGPHMENFPGVMDDFLSAQALLQVKDREELQSAIEKLLDDADLRQTYGERATRLVQTKRGVVQRSIAHITPHLA